MEDLWLCPLMKPIPCIHVFPLNLLYFFILPILGQELKRLGDHTSAEKSCSFLAESLHFAWKMAGKLLQKGFED